MGNEAPRRWGCRPEPAQRHLARTSAQYNYRNTREISDVTGCCQVTTTLPDSAAAERLALLLVEERLAACAQVLGPVSSTYRWQGATERASECYCHLKTTLDRFPALEAR